MPRNLILAYIATWLIHGSYLVHLFRKSRKLRANDQRSATND
jgi:CcmD family protein